MITLVLISDNNYNDIYTSVLKYHLISKIKDAHIYEYYLLNNDNKIYNTGAYLLLNEHNFPENSIFFIETNTPKYIPQQKILVIQYNHKWIFSPDNGVIGLLEKNKIQNIYYWKETISTSFYSKNEMLNALQNLILNNFSINKNFTITSLEHCETLNWQTITERTLPNGDKILLIPALYIDSYGNIILNFKKSDYESYKNQYEVKITLPFDTITSVHSVYNLEDNNNVMAIFNDAGYLEILIKNGNFFNLIMPKNLYNHDSPTISIIMKPKKTLIQ